MTSSRSQSELKKVDNTRNVCDSLTSYALSFFIKKTERKQFSNLIPHLHNVSATMLNESGDGLGKIVDAAGKLALQHPRGMCSFSIGVKPALVIIKPNDIRQVMCFNETKLHNEDSLGLFAKFYKGNIFDLPRGPKWREIRTLLEKWFYTDDALTEFTPKIQKLINEYVAEFIKSKSSAGLTEVDLERFATHFSMDAIGKGALGLGKFTAQDKDYLAILISEAMKEVANPKTSAQIILQNFLEKYLHCSFKLRVDGLASKAHHFLQNILSENLPELTQTKNWLRTVAEKEAKEQPRGCLNRILSRCRKTHLKLDSKRSAEEASLLLTVGHETTAKLIQTVAMLLATHPEVAKKVIEEMLHVGKKPEELTLEDLPSFPYLDKVMKEALRMYSSVPIIKTEVATKLKNSEEVNNIILGNIPTCLTKADYHAEMTERDTTQDIIVPPGTMIFIAPAITHYLPEACRFSESKEEYPTHQFIPERFGDTTPDPYAYFPFGFAPRKCLGERLAFLEAKLMTLSLLANYDFTLEAGIQHPFPTQKIMSLVHRKNIKMSFTERKVDEKLTDESKVSIRC